MQDKAKPTAALLVTGYGGLGLHTMLNLLRVFPGHFKNIVFVSVGVIDSGAFKGDESVDALQTRTEDSLKRYVAAAEGMGLAATFRMAIGTEPVEEADKLCRAVAEEFPLCTFIAGQLVFARDTWVQRVLHNQTAFAIQRRLQWAGLSMVIFPARVTL